MVEHLLSDWVDQVDLFYNRYKLPFFSMILHIIVDVILFIKNKDFLQ